MTTLSESQKKEAALKEQSSQYKVRTAELEKIIRPLRAARYEVDVDWSGIARALDGFAKDYGSLDMNPDFQRGHVWTHDQKKSYIENVLRGVVPSSGFSIQFNCANWEDDKYEGDIPLGVQCVDGLQRITAVLDFLKGDVRPFGLTVEDLSLSRFQIKSAYRFRVSIHDYTYRADLLQHYLDFNSAGTPHSAEELERVRKLFESSAPSKLSSAQSPPTSLPSTGQRHP